jgi:hypothetical protein
MKVAHVPVSLGGGFSGVPFGVFRCFVARLRFNFRCQAAHFTRTPPTEGLGGSQAPQTRRNFRS